MAKKYYYWEIEENIIDEETGEYTDKTILHKIELICSKISGKAVINIDNREFDISEKPFSLAGSQQAFRLGDMAAMLSIPKKGSPFIVIDNTMILPK